VETDRGRELLKAVGLEERLEAPARRADRGRTTARCDCAGVDDKPNLLLADEPTGNLDDKTSETILDLLWQMRTDTGATLVMVTHDQHVANAAKEFWRLSTERLSDRQLKLRANESQISMCLLWIEPGQRPVIH